MHLVRTNISETHPSTIPPLRPSQSSTHRVPAPVLQVGPGMMQHLLDKPVLPGPPPHDSLVRVWQHEADGHDPQALVHKDRRPAVNALVDLLALQTQHARDARPADVNVQESHLHAIAMPGTTMITAGCGSAGESCETLQSLESRGERRQAPRHAFGMLQDSFWRIELLKPTLPVCCLTCLSWAASAKASCAEKVLFPTPPLPERTRILCFTLSMRAAMASKSEDEQQKNTRQPKQLARKHA